MKDYVVFCDIDVYAEQQRYMWISVHNWNGPSVYQIDMMLTFPRVGGYMDLGTGIFYIPFPSGSDL